MRSCFALIALVGCFVIAGCGKSQPAASNTPAASSPAPAAAAPEETPASTPVVTEVKKVDAAGFTLGAYLPPLDDGRIEIAPPADWSLLLRDSKYVVRYYEESRNGLPRIDVVVEENGDLGMTDATETNVAEFTAAVAKEMEAGGTTLIESPVPMVIGSVPCARIVSKLKLKIGAGTILVERQTLALLHAGRL